MVSVLDETVILAAGILAGIINAVAGAGTLITFPVLLALGYPPIIANVSNSVGLLPASVAGAYAFRPELKGHWRSISLMACFSALGGAIGAVTLLLLPEDNFSTIVPFLLLIAAVLSALQPHIARWLQRTPNEIVADTRSATPGLMACILAAGIYGGYFGAAQGVILLALLGIMWSTNMNRSNGAKNVLAGTANLLSAVLFATSGNVDWIVAALIGVGAAIGGWLGGRIGRRLHPTMLRVLLVVVALTAATVLFLP